MFQTPCEAAEDRDDDAPRSVGERTGPATIRTVARRGPIVVVSHACVVAQNRAVYAALQKAGHDVVVVVPARWRTAYAPDGFDAAPTAGDGPRVRSLRVIGQGRPQRHVYLARCAALLRELAPRFVLVEEEPFSLAAWQWRRAAVRSGVPFGVQLAETLDRRLPRAAVRARDRVLADASLVVARSPKAATLAVRWGARGTVAVVPHDVAAVAPRAEPGGAFTVALVGRLVEEKGVEDLLNAVARTDGVRLVVAGAGPLTARVATAGARVELLGPLLPERVGEAYARAHVTCVPSRTTPVWEEQFGRVAVESLARAVPVVATATGALPWVLETTGGGVVVPERDPAALAAAIAGLRDDPTRARSLGEAGRTGALAAFSTDVAAAALAGALDAFRG